LTRFFGIRFGMTLVDNFLDDIPAAEDSSGSSPLEEDVSVLSLLLDRARFSPVVIPNWIGHGFCSDFEDVKHQSKFRREDFAINDRINKVSRIHILQI